MPYSTSRRVDLGIDNEKGIAFTKESINILQFDSTEMQVERSVFYLGRFGDSGKDGSSISKFLCLDVPSGSQNFSNFKDDRSHGFGGGLLCPFFSYFVENAHIELNFFSKGIIDGKRCGPSWVELILDTEKEDTKCV